MDKPRKENRREKRVKTELLPKELQNLIIRLNPQEEIIVNTDDASRNGLGFSSNADPSNYIVGTNIILYPKNEAYAIYGKIVHTLHKANNITRVGVKIKETSALEKYRKIIDGILAG